MLLPKSEMASGVPGMFKSLTQYAITGGQISVMLSAMLKHSKNSVSIFLHSKELLSYWGVLIIGLATEIQFVEYWNGVAERIYSGILFCKELLLGDILADRISEHSRSLNKKYPDRQTRIGERDIVGGKTYSHLALVRIWRWNVTLKCVLI